MEVLKRFDKSAVSVKLRNVVGRNWGWFSREDPRMHLQTVDSKRPECKVWLESKGKRVFEAVGIAGKDARKLEARVDAERASLEADWVSFAIAHDWVDVVLKGSDLIVTFYPGDHNQVERTVDLRTEFKGMYSNKVLKPWDQFPPSVTLDEEHARIAIGWQDKRDDRFTIKLAPLFFHD